MQPSSSLRANGSRECALDDRLREAIQSRKERLDCFVASLLAMTGARGRPSSNPEIPMLQIGLGDQCPDVPPLRTELELKCDAAATFQGLR